MQTSSEEEQNSALSAQAELSIDRNIAAQSCADSAQAIGQSETQQPQEKVSPLRCVSSFRKSSSDI